MTYSALIAQLQRRGQFHIKPGLDRTRVVLRALGNPHASLICIHIAGTNGKGSVAVLLESVLRQSGYRTGLYTSPHLQDVRERIQLDREPVTESQFLKAGKSIQDAEQRTGVSLTYFEFLTVMAFKIFADSLVDVAVVETGMGGRWDATNVVDRPALTVITSIGLDHTQWLGRTETAIAREKAGILKSLAPLVSGVRGIGAKVIDRRARTLKVVSRRIDANFSAHPTAVQWTEGRQSIVYRGWTGERSVTLGLLGAYQADNTAVALACLDVLREEGWNIPAWVERTAFRQVVWPGRFQFSRRAGRTLLVDGAHNVPAIQRLLSSLQESPWHTHPKTFLFSAYRDKDIKGMLRLIRPHADRLIACTLPGRRALPAKKIAASLAKNQVLVVSDPVKALQKAFEITPAPGLIVSTGSLALAGILLKSLGSISQSNSQSMKEKQICPR